MRTAQTIRRFIERELLEEAVVSRDPLAEGLLDSIAIEELVAYLEEEFGVSFQDQELVAENLSSIRALVALVDWKRKGTKEERRSENRGNPPTTLPEALARSVERGGRGFVFHLEEGPVRLGLAEVAERAGELARCLAARGIRPGDTVGVLGPNRPEWLVWAMATWNAGAAVVPLQVPLRVRDADALRERVTAFARTAGCKLVVGDPRLLFAAPDGLALAWDDPGPERATPAAPSPDDVAVVQFTSGSTSHPRAALITHAAAIAQMGNLDECLALPDRAHVFAGWAPLFHDLGLFAFIAYPIASGIEAHLLPTERFARDPLEWFRTVERTEATFTIAPSSSWAAALRAATRTSEHPNLGSLREAFFAAEAVDPAVADRLQDAADRFALSADALGSTYGLAEAVLGVSTSRCGDGLRIDEVDLDELVSAGRAVPSQGGRTRRLVSAGPPGSRFKVRIVRDDEAVPEREVGEILVRGESLMRGYLGVPDPFVDGWLRTGDLGYLADGEVYVTGRIKDLVILMGQNYYPEDFEWAAGRVTGVRPGRCVAFPRPDSEDVVLLVEPSGEERPGELPARVRHAVTDAVGVAPAEVLVVEPGTIEKTSSGKLRRTAVKEAYAEDRLAPVALS